MPAELSYTAGTADFLEVGIERSAWHREGHLIPPDREITVPAALALIHGDYPVVRRPTFYAANTAGDELRESRHTYVTVRTDTGKELGSVGRSYTVLQNEDAFRALEPLVEEGGVRLRRAVCSARGPTSGCSAGSSSNDSAPSHRLVLHSEARSGRHPLCDQTSASRCDSGGYELSRLSVEVFKLPLTALARG